MIQLTSKWQPKQIRDFAGLARAKAMLVSARASDAFAIHCFRHIAIPTQDLEVIRVSKFNDPSIPIATCDSIAAFGEPAGITESVAVLVVDREKVQVGYFATSAPPSVVGNDFLPKLLSNPLVPWFEVSLALGRMFFDPAHDSNLVFGRTIGTSASPWTSWIFAGGTKAIIAPEFPAVLQVFTAFLCGRLAFRFGHETHSLFGFRPLGVLRAHPAAVFILPAKNTISNVSSRVA